MAVCQKPWCSSVHIKIAGKWMFIHVHSPKSCLVDFNVYPKNKNKTAQKISNFVCGWDTPSSSLEMGVSLHLERGHYLFQSSLSGFVIVPKIWYCTLNSLVTHQCPYLKWRFQNFEAHSSGTFVAKLGDDVGVKGQGFKTPGKPHDEALFPGMLVR